MKIAVNGRLLTNRLEGIGQYIVQVVKNMAAQHPEDEFIILTDRKKHKPILLGSNVQYFKIGLPTRHPVLWKLWFEYSVPKALSEVKADLFFSPEGMMSTRCSIPTLMTIHDLAYIHYPDASISSHKNYLVKNFPKFITASDRISCVSNFTQKDVIAQFPASRDKCFVAHNGLNQEFVPINEERRKSFRERLTNGQSYILYLGSIHPRKNIARLIRAYEFLRSSSKKRCHLILAGRMAWNSREIEEMIANSAYYKEIKHLDNFDDNLTNLVGAADCMCYISLFEGFGLPTLEAMGSGVPVVTSRASAMEEVCENAAVYVDPNDVTSIANGLNKALNNADLKTQMIAEGLKQANKFKWKNTAAQIYKALTELHSSNQFTKLQS